MSRAITTTNRISICILAAVLMAGCGKKPVLVRAPVMATFGATTDTAAPIKTSQIDAVVDCAAGQLSATFQMRGSLMGNTKAEVIVTNDSNASCLLQGYPEVDAFGEGGNYVKLETSQGTYFGDPVPLKSMGPNQRAAVYLTGGITCEAYQAGKFDVQHSFGLRLASGGLVRVDADLDTTCGLSVSQFGQLDPDPVPAGTTSG